MAGDDNRDRIIVIGLADGAERLRTANFAGNFGICAGFSVRNSQQRLLAVFLKGSVGEIKFESEFP